MLHLYLLSYHYLYIRLLHKPQSKAGIMGLDTNWWNTPLQIENAGLTNIHVLGADKWRQILYTILQQMTYLDFVINWICFEVGLSCPASSPHPPLPIPSLLFSILTSITLLIFPPNLDNMLPVLMRKDAAQWGCLLTPVLMVTSCVMGELACLCSRSVMVLMTAWTCQTNTTVPLIITR